MEQTLIQLLTNYGWLAILLGAFFFGETVILTAAFLAHQGWWRVYELFVLALIGTVLSDSLWFLLGQKLPLILKKIETKRVKLQVAMKTINRLTGTRPFLALLFIKFLYGTRLIFIFYLSANRIKFRTFSIYNSLGTGLWLLVMITLGWLAGTGTNTLTTVDIKQIEIYLTIILILIIAVKLTSKWITNKIAKK